MSWPAIDGFRKWVGKRKGLFMGLVGVAVEETINLVPGGSLAVRIAGELAKHGIDRLGNPQAEMPDLKPAGQAFPNDQLDQINGWLETLTASYAGILDRLEALVPAAGDEPWEQMTLLVKGALLKYEDLGKQFDGCAREVRLQTLSLARMEERLDEYFHGQQKIAQGLEDVKNILAQSPLMGDWAEFHKARPEAVQALNQADAYFLAGRREEGVGVYLALLKEQHGIGEATLCRALGVAAVAQGKLSDARRYLTRSSPARGTMPGPLVRTLTSLGAASQREVALPVWRSLPRGLVVEHRYRIEAEVGRGGMASVYRAVCIDWVNQGKIVALKMPAPDLLADESTRRRFVQEIQVSQRLSGQHPAIVATLGYAIFDDPHSGQKLYALVLEYVDGMNLAQFLEQRKAAQRPLTPPEVLAIMKPVCRAVAAAHAQVPPILHRDLKPHNVMLTRKGEARLMDFGIARVLEEQRDTLSRLSEGAIGTPAYMPAEFLQPGVVLDGRSDVYLAGNLLLELLTFSPFGDAESRADCPPAWVKLIADAMNRVRGQRPATMLEFLDRLLGEKTSKPPEAVPIPIKTDPKPAKTVQKTLAEELEELLKRQAQILAEARQLAEKNQDYAGAARMLETIPEGNRDAKLYAEVCRRRDQAVEVEARRLAEKGQEYTEAARLLEGIPEAGRDANLFAEICRRRDRVAELEEEVTKGIRSGRLSGLRPQVEEWLKLQPRRKGELQALLERLPKEPEKPKEIVNSIGVKFVWIPPGTFLMGSPSSEEGRYDNETQHRVSLTKGFYLGVYPVTQGQWQAVMGNNPSHFKGDNRPVESVSWEDCREFCRKLSTRERKEYRLPTEAEWEYGCRAGTTTAYCFGDNGNQLGNYAWFEGNSGSQTHPVGEKKPNAWGLYDMHGNVWEWCQDWYGDYGGDGVDLEGPGQGSYRVIRGGSWNRAPQLCRSADRYGDEPGYRVNFLGCRLALVPSG